MTLASNLVDDGNYGCHCLRTGIQPFLHPPHRGASGTPLGKPFLAGPGARSVRTRAEAAGNRRRAGPGTRPGCRIPQPHPGGLRKAQAPHPPALESRRPPVAPAAHRRRTSRLPPSRQTIHPGGQCHAGVPDAAGTGAPGGGHGDHRGVAGAGGSRGGSLRTAAAPPGRHGLGDPSPRRAVRPGVSLGRDFRMAGGGHCR